MTLAALSHVDLPSWILLAVALLVAWRVTRGGGGSAVTELSAANGVLEKRVHELETQVSELRHENLALAARTDFTQALSPLLVATETHEARAVERSTRILSVLDTIAERLAA